MATQYEEIESFLVKGNSITALEALTRFGCFRLAAVICILRNNGYFIDTINVSKDGKHFAKYVLSDYNTENQHGINIYNH